MSHPDPGGLWCRRYRPARNAAARLVCLPHAGGSAPFYLPVAAALAPAVDVIAIQYPGRQDRRAEPPLTTMAALADAIAAILAGQPALPLTLFGHSMGAVLAFEIARRLESGGQPPVHLYVSGRRGPATYRDETIHTRGDAGIIAEVRAMNGTASALLADDELMQAALPALRADYTATETYVCSPADAVIHTPITALTGDSDPKTTPAEASAWAAHTTATFTLHTYSGGHFFLTDHADQVVSLLRQHFQTQPVPSGLLR